MVTNTHVKKKIGHQYGDPLLGVRIRKLRLEKGLDQKAFAAHLGVKQAIVSQWETGKHMPSAIALRAIARMATKDVSWWEGRIGIESQRNDGVTSEIEIDRRKRNRRANPFVEVRLVSGFAGAGPAHIHETEEYDGILTIPKDVCPNPAETRCIRVKGESMEPTIADGTIDAVDGSQRKVERLTGKVVAAWHETEGVLLKRLVRVGGKLRLASDNPGYDPRDLQDGWELVGRVIWWIQKA